MHEINVTLKCRRSSTAAKSSLRNLCDSSQKTLYLESCFPFNDRKSDTISGSSISIIVLILESKSDSLKLVEAEWSLIRL